MKEVKAVNHLHDDFYTIPQMACKVMTTQQVRETLLYTDNFIMACGHNWRLKIKNLGAGMKEVSLIPFK